MLIKLNQVMFVGVLLILVILPLSACLSAQATEMQIKHECSQGLNKVDINLRNITDTVLTNIIVIAYVPCFIQMYPNYGKLSTEGDRKEWILDRIRPNELVQLHLCTYPFAISDTLKAKVYRQQKLDSALLSQEFVPTCPLGEASANHFSVLKEGNQFIITATTFTPFQPSFAFLDRDGKVIHEFRLFLSKPLTRHVLEVTETLANAEYLVGQGFSVEVEIAKIQR